METDMQYLVQRLIHNESEWVHPVPRRLGRIGEGEYVQKNGFGHEDWNFNTALTNNGYMFGYFYHRPSEDKQREHFDIAFTVYRRPSWWLVGFYRDAEFIASGCPLNRRILGAKADDLWMLRDSNSLGKAWMRLRKQDIAARLRKEDQWVCWRVAVQNVLALRHQVLVPRSVYSSKNRRLTKPTEIDEATFRRLWSLGLAARGKPEDDETEFPEGREVQYLHRSRERNAQVIKIAKERFLEMYGRLFCAVCGFDFEATYGPDGAGFIEAHHTIPVSELGPNHSTKAEDIAVVCANCHRMLHLRRPWLTMDDLHKLISR
jgi:hypothetical protein